MGGLDYDPMVDWFMYLCYSLLDSVALMARLVMTDVTVPLQLT